MKLRRRSPTMGDAQPQSLWKRFHCHIIANVRVWAATAGAVALLGSYMVSSTLWLKHQIESFQTDEEAATEYKKLREEAANEYVKLRAEIEQKVVGIRTDLNTAATRVERKQLWSTVGQIRLEALILRNRVNECNEKRDHSAACEQYKDELKDAQERFNEARKIANEASK